MNKAGLIFNIILSVLVFFGACQKTDYATYTGLYNANVRIIYSEKGKILDTSFSSLLIVNQVYGDNQLEIQWTLDNYLRLENKSFFIPNILKAKVQTSVFDNKRFLSCHDPSCYFDDITGDLRERELKLKMESSRYPITILITAVKYEE